jgi:hypothetical protein
MTKTIEAPAGFTATELASHVWIATLPQAEKAKLADLLLQQTAIASLDPALSFQIQRDHLNSEVKQIQGRLFGLQGVLRCFRALLQSDNPDVVDGLICCLSELESLADVTETVAEKLQAMKLPA